MKKIAILGSTGSIGISALEVIGAKPDRLSVVAMSAGRNIELLEKQIRRYRPALAAVINEVDALALARSLGNEVKTEIVWGEEGLRLVAAADDATMVLSAIVGAAGMIPTLEAINAGKDIALANKETLVMAGGLVMEIVRRKDIRIIPVDSEHSAVFQCLEGNRRQDLKRIILTASGGPFLNHSPESLKIVTAADALRHPNWIMGKKITIDSATMMNKGLEVIEARWLFGLSIDEIKVCIHPQSVIHSMVEYVDGSVMAQLGVPDMKGPIAYAFSYPERFPGIIEPVDFFKTGKLEFLRPDFARFPCLKLAYEAARKGGTIPCAMNAANEIAVDAFLSGRIGFTDIPEIIERVMASHDAQDASTVEQILEADNRARSEARNIIEGYSRRS